MTDSGNTGRPELVSTSPERIRLRVLVRNRTPGSVFRDWTDPLRVRLWWAPEATIEARPGGRCEFAWPKMNWRLRGKFDRFEPGHALSFSWCWDHEPEVTKQVDVVFREVPGGTELTVDHGTYAAIPRDTELRHEHIDGWVHFLARLASLEG